MAKWNGESTLSLWLDMRKFRVSLLCTISFWCVRTYNTKAHKQINKQTYVHTKSNANKQTTEPSNSDWKWEKERKKRVHHNLFAIQLLVLVQNDTQNGQHGQGYGSFYISSLETKNTIFKRHIIHNASTKSRRIKRSERKYYAFFWKLNSLQRFSIHTLADSVQ